MKENSATFTKKQNLLKQQERSEMIIRNRNFVCGTFLKRAKGVRRQNLATSQFHWHWQISTLIKYSSLLAVKNVTNVSIIWSQNNGNLSVRFCKKKTGYDRSWTNATLIQGLFIMIIHGHSYSWLSPKYRIYTHYLFFKENSFHIFLRIYFLQCPCGVHVLAIPK